MTPDRTMPWKVGESVTGALAVLPRDSGGWKRLDGSACLPSPICTLGVGWDRTEAEARAYAIRIVACVNALAGVPTEDLFQLVEMACTDASRLASLSLAVQHSMREAELVMKVGVA